MITKNHKRINVVLNFLLVVIALFSLALYEMYGRERHQIEGMRIARNLMIESLERANISYWEWHVNDNKVIWSDSLKDILGVKHDDKPTYDKWLKFVHPEDRDMADYICKKSAETGKSYDHSYRIIVKNEILYAYESAAIDIDKKRMIGIFIAHPDEQTLINQIKRIKKLESIKSQT